MSIDNLWAESKAADAGNFAKHPLGDYQATITDIKERDHEGKAIYELILTSDVGTAKYAIWELGEADLAEIGRERFLASLARRKQLVVDLGQPEPATHAEWLRALGQCIGAKCTLVVRASTKKNGEIVTFINKAIPAGQVAGLGARGNLPKPAAALGDRGNVPMPTAGLKTPGY